MAASRSLTGCLALWLLVSGCQAPSLRWNRFRREPVAAANETRAEPDADEIENEAALSPPMSVLRDLESQFESAGGNDFAHSDDSPSAPPSPAAFLERYSQANTPSAPEVVADVPTNSRPVALSGEIDADADPFTPDSEHLAAQIETQAEHFASAQAPTTTGELPVAGDSQTRNPTAAAARHESSPWGLPRIPDVLGMSRLAEESASSDWTLGIGERLMPGSRTDEPPSKTEPPVRSASLPETLPADGAVWNGSSAYSQEELAKLISLIETELAGVTPTTESERRDYLRCHVLLRNLYLLAGRPHDAQQVVPDIDPADQEFWTEINWAMASYFDEEMLPSRSDRAAQTVTRLASAQRALDPLVPLEIRNLQFCRHIDGFGNYETFGVNEFTAGQQLLLYTEVRHFMSESDPSGVYRTLLESEIEIYSEGPTRELIDRTVFPSTEDLCRTRRSDYFHSYRIDLPSSLQPGTYVLELTVEDRLAGKAATESRRFVVVP
jgi:hypothetical protein